MKQRHAAAVWHLSIIAIISGCVTSNVATLPSVPEPLRVPAGQILIKQVHATGVQIYGCTASKDSPVRFEWTLKAPEAELRDRGSHIFGRHYAGPTWEAFDGSKVVGEVSARDPGPDPNAIPWLLLRATAASGHGVLSDTKSIQRMGTSGGKAPPTGCDETLLGKELRVPYQADYYFYASRS
jgi:hypothetical protein